MATRIAIVVVAFGAAVCVAGSPSVSPSYTVTKSKFAGVFVDHVDVTPAKFDWKGKTYEFNEAWCERYKQFNRQPGLLRRSWEVGEGYRICFSLKSGRHSPVGLDFDSGFFMLDGRRGASFGGNSVVFWTHVDRIPPDGWTVHVTTDFKFTDALSLKFTPRKSGN